MAVVAGVAALGLLVTLVVWRRQDLVGVVLALLCVLLAVVAGVSVAAAREADEPPGADAQSVDAPPQSVDADTLEALDSRDALRAVRERRQRLSDP